MGIVTFFGAVAFASPTSRLPTVWPIYFGSDEPKARFGRYTSIYESVGGVNW